MEQPSIYFDNFTLYEPITVLTNLILSALCLAFCLRLGKLHARYWPMFFCLLSFSAFFGALGHGLYPDKNNILQLISRMGIIIAVCLGSIASICFLTNKNFKLFLNVFSLTQLFVAITLIVLFNNFLIVKWDGILGLGVIMGSVHIYLSIKGNRGSLFILYGIALNSIAGLVHRFQISPNKWFNYNDLGHVILMAGFYLMATGALRLQHYVTK